MIIGQQTTLNDVEQRLVKTVAKLRNEENRNKNLKDRKLSDEDSVSLDVQGFGGEVAFCKAFNLYPDTLIKARKAVDDRGDVTWSGLCLDVKATKKDDGCLLISSWKKSRYIDGYALMTGTFPAYVYRGMIDAEEATQDWWLKDLGRGDTYVVPQSKLKETI